MGNYIAAMKLAKWRQNARLTVTETAGRAGVSVASMSRIERGLQYPSRSTMLAIKRMTNDKVKSDDFLANT